ESGNAGQTNYAACKGGMIAMNKSFALEGASRNIRFNAITPGFIATEMTEVLKQEVKDAFTSKIPLARFGEPTEVAQAVAFLLSDYASYITGETLKVNGGMYI
ncbi:MAG: SDR family oxidoreductase, partial [Sulfurovaceae bacterium]